jgi:uncharacterized spore protein YtfJ
MTAANEGILDDIAERAQRGLEPFADVSAARIFGDPVEGAGRVVIPAAAFGVGVGFGFGGGSDEANDVGGGGGGWGGYKQGRPVAVIEVTADGVRVQPVLDWTRIGITVLVTALVAWRTTRRTTSP